MRVLSELEVGESGVLVAMDLPPGVQNHLMYMGLVPDARVKALHRAPAGDPTVYSVDGIEIALRRETAQSIWVAKKSITRLDVEDLGVNEWAPAAADPSATTEATELTEAAR